MNPKFLSPVNLVNTATLIGLDGVFGLGLGLVIITGGIDLWSAQCARSRESC
jgi:ribose transport system permease protein